jgi:hypothetical protein
VTLTATKLKLFAVITHERHAVPWVDGRGAEIARSDSHLD